MPPEATSLKALGVARKRSLNPVTSPEPAPNTFKTFRKRRLQPKPHMPWPLLVVLLQVTLLHLRKMRASNRINPT